MVYGALKYISKTMYIPLNISAIRNHLVAFANALSFDSSHVFGFGTLKPSGLVAILAPAVALAAFKKDAVEKGL